MRYIGLSYIVHCRLCSSPSEEVGYIINDRLSCEHVSFILEPRIIPEQKYKKKYIKIHENDMETLQSVDQRTS